MMAQKHLVNSRALTHTLLLPICRSSLSTAFQNDPRRAIERKKNEKKKKNENREKERKKADRKADSLEIERESAGITTD